MIEFSEFGRIVIFAASLLGLIAFFDRVFGRDSFVALVGLIGVVALLLSLLGFVDLPISTINRWIN